MQEWESYPGCIQKFQVGSEEILVPTLKCLEVVFTNILTVFVSLAVLALFVMFIIAGLKYLTSSGDAKKAESARSTMTYALAGIFLMAIAFLIFRLIQAITGVDVTKFEIGEISK